MSRPVPPENTQPPQGDPCEKLAADIEEATAKGRTENEERKAYLSAQLAEDGPCPDVRASLSPEAQDWLAKQGI